MFKLRRNKKDKKDSAKNKDNHQQSPSIHSKESMDESDRHTAESTHSESMSPDISVHSASDHSQQQQQQQQQQQSSGPQAQNPFQMSSGPSQQRQLPMLPTAGQSLSPIENPASNIQALMRGPVENNNTGGSFSRQPAQQQQQQQQQQFNNQRANPPGFNNGRVPPNGFQQQQQQRQMANVSPQVLAQQQQQLITAIQNFTPWIRVKMLESPFPRYRHTASSIISEQGHIFAMGGLREGSVYGDLWAINSASMEARTIENFDGIPAPRVGHNSCLCGNAFIVFGGDTIQTNEKGELDNDLYLFNINSLKWTIPHPQGDRPCGRYGHTIGVVARTNVQSKLFLFGGQLDSQIFNDLWIFDLSSFRKPNSHWDKVSLDADNAPALTNHSMVIHNYKLYIFGGATINSLSNELFCFDPDALRFTKFRCFGDIPPPMEEHSATTIKHLMFVYGGKNSKNEPIGDMYILNLNTLYWTRVESFALNPGARCGHSLTAITAKRSLSIESSSSIHTNMQRRFTNVSINPQKISDNASSSTTILASSNNKLVIMGGDQLDYSSPVPGNFERLNKDENAGVMIYVFDVDLYNEWSIKFKMYDLWDDKPPQISISKNMMPVSKFSTPNSSAMVAGSNNGSGVFASTASAIPDKHLTSANNISNTSSPHIKNKEILEPARKSIDLIDSYVNFSNDHLDSQAGNSSAKKIPPPSEAPVNISVDSQNMNGDDTNNSFKSPTTASLAGLVPISAISVGSPEINHNQPTMDPAVKPKGIQTSSLPPMQNESNPQTSVHNDNDISQSPLSNTEKQQFAEVIGSLESELAQLKLEMDNQAKSVSDKIHDLEVTNSKLIEENNSLKEVNAVSHKELSNHLTSLQNDHASLQNDHVAAKNRIVELENNLSNTSEKDELASYIQQLQGQLHEKEMWAKQSETDKETLNQNSERLKKVLQDRDSTIQSLQNEIEAGKALHSKNLAISNETATKEFEILKQQLLERDEKIVSLNAAVRASSPSIGDTTASKELKKDIDVVNSDYGALKRENIELHSELIKLQADNETLNQKFNEFEPIMNNSIDDLANLNSVIKHQQEIIDELNIKSQKSEEYLSEIQNLQTENDILKKEVSNLKKNKSSQRAIANEQINSISTDIGKLVSLWKSKKEVGSELDRSLLSNNSTTVDDTEDFEDSNLEGVNRSVLSIGSTSSSNNRAFGKLQAQLSELIQLNKEYEMKNINLQGQLDDAKASAVNNDDVSKLEENYKSAVNSVKKTGRALDMSQKELNKQKDISNELRLQLEELQLKFKSNAFDNEGGQKDDDHEMNQYDFKIKDLEAELFIIKQERDELKDSVVSLRKKLINSGSN